MKKIFIFSLGIVALLSIGREGDALTYPATKQVPTQETLHGKKLEDSYRWLEGNGEEVQEWAQAQTEHSRSVIGAGPHTGRLSKRYDELWRYDDATAPEEVLHGKRCFFRAKTKDQDRWVMYTKKDSVAPAVKLFDPNEWEEKKSLNEVSPSRDGRYVAYGIASGGDENPIIRILDVETEKLLPDTLQGWKHGCVCWHSHNEGFFYMACPKAGEVPKGEEFYWHSAYYHKLGTSSDQDKKVFFSKDEKECFHIGSVTEDGRWEIFARMKFSKSEIFFRRHGTNDSLTPLATGFDGNYFVDIANDKIYIMTDVDAPMNQLLITDVNTPERAHWKVVIPENAQSKIENFAVIGSHLYVSRSESAHTKIEIYDRAGNYLKDFPLPGIGSASVQGYASKPEVRLYFSSFFSPPEVFEYAFDTDTLTSIHRTPIDVDTSRFEVQQVWYPSKDGTRVSMFILRNKEIVLDGSHPTLLTGYGGFDVSLTPGFAATLIPWLEMGGVVAIPNLRGGGEYGTIWHEAGMKEKKQNVFDDFIAAAEWLIQERYTTSEKLAIKGGSNGGLLVGAALTQRPELFRAILCQVPLLDMIHYHKFGLANIWKEEYGTADDPKQFEYLLKYSPYHNIKEGTKYPATLITCALNDARVDPFHARKMVALLQAANAGDHPILLFSEISAGHLGGTTLSQLISQQARQMAFLMQQLDMYAPPKEVSE